MYRNYTTLPLMCKLFEGIPSAKIDELFAHLAVREVALKKGEVLFRSGSKITDFAVVISGQLNISFYEADGHRKILELLEPMDTVAISLAVAEIQSVSISVEARQDSDVILFNADKVFKPAGKPSEEHMRLLRNITRELARKTVFMGRKMRTISIRGTSGRLMKYLIEESVRRGCKEFEIPYDRQALADYLVGREIASVNDLYRPGEIVPDVDGFSGATIRAPKVISAIWDGLGRHAYRLD